MNKIVIAGMLAIFVWSVNSHGRRHPQADVLGPSVPGDHIPLYGVDIVQFEEVLFYCGDRGLEGISGLYCFH